MKNSKVGLKVQWSIAIINNNHEVHDRVTCGFVFSHIVQIFFSLLCLCPLQFIFWSSSCLPVYTSVCVRYCSGCFLFRWKKRKLSTCCLSLSSFPFLLTVNCCIYSTEHLLCHCHFCSLYADRGLSEPIQRLFKETVHPKIFFLNVPTFRPDGQDPIQIWSNLLHNFLTTWSSAVNVIIIDTAGQILLHYK